MAHDAENSHVRSERGNGSTDTPQQSKQNEGGGGLKSYFVSLKSPDLDTVNAR